jgi:ankyrin repeat protein
MTAPHLMEQADEDGFKPIHLAVIQGTLETVNLLLANKVDVNALDNEGHSVIHWATGDYSLFITINKHPWHKKKTIFANVFSFPFSRKLFLVCGEAQILRALLSAGADATIPDTNGATPLHYAAQMCGYDGKNDKASTKLALDILNILLKYSKSMVEVEDKDGRQPLMWAASAGSEDAILALIKAGAYAESSDK